MTYLTQDEQRGLHRALSRSRLMCMKPWDRDPLTIPRRVKVLPSPVKSDTTVEMWSEAFKKVKSW